MGDIGSDRPGHQHVVVGSQMSEPYTYFAMAVPSMILPPAAFPAEPLGEISAAAPDMMYRRLLVVPDGEGSEIRDSERRMEREAVGMEAVAVWNRWSFATL